MGLQVFTCTDHAGHYPVGVASIVVAPSIEAACDLLDAELVKRGLKPGGYSLVGLNMSSPHVCVLCDGDY